MKAPVAPAKWAASTKVAEYNKGTAAAAVNVDDPLTIKMADQKACVPAKFGTIYTADYTIVKPATKAKKTAPADPKAEPKATDTPYVWNATTNNGLPKVVAKPEAKKEEKKPAAKDAKAPAKDAKAADKKDTKAAAVPDGPGKCVKEALCDTTDAKTSAKITCDAVRLGAAALAALAVASTL